MRFIPTRIHAILDYIVGVLLIAAPFLFGFTGGAAMWVPIIIGAGILLMALATRYEYGVFNAINMRTHLWVDVAVGAFLAVSPWLFGFSEVVWVPHLVVGLFAIGAGLTTHTVPSRVRATQDRRTTA